ERPLANSPDRMAALRPRAEDDQDRRPLGQLEQPLGEGDRGRVGPVEVVEEDSERPLGGEALEDVGDRGLDPILDDLRGGIRAWPTRNRTRPDPARVASIDSTPRRSSSSRPTSSAPTAVVTPTAAVAPAPATTGRSTRRALTGPALPLSSSSAGSPKSNRAA